MASRPLQSSEVVGHAEQQSRVENEAERLRDTPGMLFCERFVNTLDHTGVKDMQSKQQEMLNDLEIANIKLLHCVNLSEAKYEEAAPLLKDSTRRLVSMKRDVESLHRRIRVLKTKLARKYPSVVAECDAKFRVAVPDIDDYEDEEGDDVKKETSILKNHDRPIQTKGNLLQLGSDSTTTTASSLILQDNAGHGSESASSLPSPTCDVVGNVSTAESTTVDEDSRGSPLLINGSEKQEEFESEECTSEHNDLGCKESVNDSEVPFVKTNQDEREDSEIAVSGKFEEDLEDGISSS